MEKRDPIRFFAERPLGRLAKWLRLLGFDTLYEPDIPKPVREREGEGRIRLTRTRKSRAPLPAPFVLFIRSDHLEGQLRQVVHDAPRVRADARPFSRCIRCNDVIHRVDKAAVASRVPDHVWETQEMFSACRSCGRVYWPGTHTRRAARFIESLLDAASSRTGEE